MHDRLLIHHLISWFHIVEWFLHPLFATYIEFPKKNVMNALCEEECERIVAELEERWNLTSMEFDNLTKQLMNSLSFCFIYKGIFRIA